MKVLKAELSNSKINSYADIELPASYEGMKDALHRARMTPQDKEVSFSHFLGESKLIGYKEMEPCSLYELNYLANLLSEMDVVNQEHFKGLVELTQQEETVSVDNLINIALNMPLLDSIYMSATTDAELGEFYVDNELLDELVDLDSLSDELYEWVCDHLDLAKIGKEMREAEHGVFSGIGYVVKNEELKPLYDGKPIVPEPKDYVFKLEIAKAPTGDEPNDENTVSLTLPASASDIIAAVEKAGENSLDECCFYDYESTIPQLGELFEDMSDFDTLNELAYKIETMREYGNVPKFKAMLETLENYTLDTALEVTAYMGDFEVEYDCASSTDYANKALLNIDLPLKDQLMHYLSKDGYGSALMQKNGVEYTSYGLLVPYSGQTLSQQMQKENPTLDMKMGM